MIGARRCLGHLFCHLGPRSLRYRPLGRLDQVARREAQSCRHGRRATRELSLAHSSLCEETETIPAQQPLWCGSLTINIAYLWGSYGEILDNELYWQITALVRNEPLDWFSHLPLLTLRSRAARRSLASYRPHPRRHVLSLPRRLAPERQGFGAERRGSCSSRSRQCDAKLGRQQRE